MVSSARPHIFIIAIRRPAGPRSKGRSSPAPLMPVPRRQAARRCKARPCCPIPIAPSRSGPAPRPWRIWCAMPMAICCCSCMKARASCSAISAIFPIATAITSFCRAAPCGGWSRRNPTIALQIEARNGGFRLPDRGLLGPHAQFDPAALDTPKLDDAFRAQRGRRLESLGQAAGSDLHHLLSLQSPGRDGLEGQPGAGEAQLARHPPGDEPSLSSAAQRAFDLRGRSLRGLHLRAAAVRKRSGRAESAVLPFQRRFRRSDLLSCRAISSAATISGPAW